MFLCLIHLRQFKNISKGLKGFMFLDLALDCQGLAARPKIVQKSGVHDTPLIGKKDWCMMAIPEFLYSCVCVS